MKNLLLSGSVPIIGEAINNLARYGETREYQKTERHRISSEMKENIARIHAQRDLLKDMVASQHVANMAVINNVGASLMEATMQNNTELAAQYCQLLLGVLNQGQSYHLAAGFLQDPQSTTRLHQLSRL